MHNQQQFSRQLHSWDVQNHCNAPMPWELPSTNSGVHNFRGNQNLPHAGNEDRVYNDRAPYRFENHAFSQQMTSQFSAIARPPLTALSEGYYANESRPGSVTSQNSHCAPSLHRDLPPPSRPASVCSSVGSITSLPDSDSQASSSGWKPSEIRAWNDSDWTQGTPAAGCSGYGQPPTHSNHSSMSSFDLIDCPSVPSRQSNHTNSVPASFHPYILSFPEHSRMLVAQVTAHVSDVYQAEIATLWGAIQSALTRYHRGQSQRHAHRTCL
ncbi:hypothetical protein PLEOSDRAFT_1100086 [Pleurotus ostreatus PC15]|uniref:Uncharacterized protein n=1 Tax=Pleurotus ostreatus (strain PC15) TaxID=1137138 RepID=A0A067P4I0_PLEO1|nr:hypothetical protein PLEOSDRAFT_1100086 [Pleurotus ostreatus PC15]